jgi:hypothetical protein
MATMGVFNTNKNTYSIGLIVISWAAWIAILFLFQELVANRIDLVRSDKSIGWVIEETAAGRNTGQPYLNSPFLNSHVAWDSEYYLSIATAGYDDPSMRQVVLPGRDPISTNYAFMPLLPFAMRVLSTPLSIFKLDPIATATLAGILLSLLGTLAGMVSLYTLAKDWLGEDGGRRAAFYMLIFPTGFFLAQVYTEGLFIGLAFTSLALMRRRRWLAAAILAALATWTRSVGVLLIIPMFYNAFRQTWEGKISSLFKPAALYAAAWSLAPALAYLAWRRSPLYVNFMIVEDAYFHRGFLLISQSLGEWREAFQQSFHFCGQGSMYYLLEFAMIGVALAASLALLRKQPDIALFSLAVFTISMFSGQAQSMCRYVLACPAIFLGLAWLGKHETVDRGWTVASLLLMGLLATLFTFNLWVG